MRALLVFLLILASAIGFAQKPKAGVIVAKNQSVRDVHLEVSLRQGDREVPVGQPTFLAAHAKERVISRFFGTPLPKAHYTINVFDAKRRRLGLFRVNAQMVQAALKNGMSISVQNQAVNVRLGSRRQRFLLLP